MTLASDPRNRRWPQPLNSQLPSTVKWVSSLPMEIQPLSLLQQMPRIANALAKIWHDEVALRQYFDELLTDRRGGRRGFPAEIHHELVLLRAYCEGRYPWGPSSG